MKRNILVWTTLLVLVFSAISLAETPLDLFNSSFEVLPEGVQLEDALGLVPYGWVVSPPSSATEWEIGLTNERAFDGDLSLKVHVRQAQGGILISSKPLPAEPGKTYAALANVFNVRSEELDNYPIQIYLQFWGDETWWRNEELFWSEGAWLAQRRGQWTSRLRLGTDTTISKGFEEWVEVVVISQAPPGTKYVTFDIWTANRSMLAYVDAIQLVVLD